MRVSDSATGTLDGVGFQNHSISSEYRIFGPPGTGKTTSLADVIRRDAGKYGPDAVLVTSFSRTAAGELVNCRLPISPDRVGTLHSHCFAALGSPVIAEVHVKEWNRANPALALTPMKDQRRLHGEESMGDEDSTPAHGGDALLQELNRYRGLMIEPRFWSTRVRDFERKWTRYKLAAGLLDFCDLIETCLKDVSVASGNPSVIFADEAQDLNRMQVNLIRKWGQQADYYVLAFDDDQTIFTFTGASPEAILDPEIPRSHKVILTQSHRVPRAVHRLANGLIRQVTRRQPKVYRPRPEEGRVVRFSAGGYKSPEYFILSTATKHLEQGKTIMFLASSSYMLKPLLAVLRKSGIPFHNPYRKANGFWNPLRLGNRGSAARRILSLLGAHPGWAGAQRSWESDQLLSWTEWLAPKAVLKAGARDRLLANLRIPEDRIKRWLEADPRFRDTWFRQRKDLHDQSQSGYDLALACFGFGAGLTEQEIVDLIVHHRAQHKQKQRSRLDYFQRTISKAALRTDGNDELGKSMGLRPRSAGPSSSESDQGSSATVGADMAANKAAICNALSEVLGPKIHRITKISGHSPVFHMELAEGKAEFSNVGKLISQTCVRNTLAGITGKLMRRFKSKEWEKVAQALLDACTVEEGGEEMEMEGSARLRLVQYLSPTAFIASLDGQSRDNARKPMVADGFITVCSSDIQTFINKTTSENVTIQVVVGMLYAVGAKSRRFRGKFPEQSRWVLPPDKFAASDYAVPAGEELADDGQ